MESAFDELRNRLRRLPGVGFRSAERLALHLLVEHPQARVDLVRALEDAGSRVGRCGSCGHLAEGPVCPICADAARDAGLVCVVERVPDVLSLERSGAYRGRYHVLHGRLSPLNDVGPEQLNIGPLRARLEAGEVREMILALSNDIEGEATCHYLTTHLPVDGVRLSRIGFGLPSGGGVLHADAVTLRSALEGRRGFP